MELIDLGIPRFAILLAAYNGVHWLPSQIDSILSQANVDITIYVSVDASSDGTEDWFLAQAANDPRIVILSGGLKFGGAARNFFRLIRDVDFSKYDYVSFSDQDDIWLPDKLLAAHKKISMNGFSAYSGNVMAFWPDGRKILIDKAQRQRKYDFLFEAAGPGCTYVLKTSDALLFKAFLLKNWDGANEVSLHDWLIYAWFRANGLKWYIDSVPKMLYRQHGGNQVGANSGLKAIKARASLLRAGWYRSEVAKIATLLSLKLPGLPSSLSMCGVVPVIFLIKNFNQLRRRLRDRILLAFIVTLGIY